MWEDSNELAEECNRVLSELMNMPEEERDEWVRSVLRWFIGITEQMTNEVLKASKGGMLDKVRLAKRVKEIKEKYGPIIEEKKPQIIVALTYTIKPEFQEEFAPFLYSTLGLV